VDADQGALILQEARRAPWLLRRAGEDVSARARSRGQKGMCVFITAVPIIKLFAWGEGARAAATMAHCGQRDD
jgi:hypothetical protein